MGPFDENEDKSKIRNSELPTDSQVPFSCPVYGVAKHKTTDKGVLSSEVSQKAAGTEVLQQNKGF